MEVGPLQTWRRVWEGGLLLEGRRYGDEESLVLVPTGIVAVVEKYSMLKRNTTLLPQHCDSIGRERSAFFTGNQ